MINIDSKPSPTHPHGEALERGVLYRNGGMGEAWWRDALEEWGIGDPNLSGRPVGGLLERASAGGIQRWMS